MIRLETLAPGLVAALRTSSATMQRAASVAACEFAVRQSGADHPAVLAGVEKLRSAGTLSSKERAVLDDVVARLDDIYLTMQAGATPSTCEDYVKVFRQARAAASVWFAGDDCALTAALESIYEASAAIDKREELFGMVIAVLEGRL